MLPVPARVEACELLDEPASVQRDLPANLRDIRRLNHWFGRTALARRYVRSLLGASTSATLLDVATGSADIPAALLAWAAAAGVDLDVVALDVSEEILGEARKVTSGKPLRLVRADARELPFADGSFDLVTCFLALHHFPPADAGRVLGEMWRVARRAILVIDLDRSYGSYLATWLATRSVARNRLTRHDGPLSVLRAYRQSELLALARRAGLENVRVRRHSLSRTVLIASKGM